MKCQECRNQFSAYFEDSLPQTVRSQIEAHLKACAACHGEWTGFQSVMEELKEVGRVHAPAGIEAAVLRRLRNLAAAGSTENWVKASLWKYCLGTAACTAIICFLFFWTFARAETGTFASLDASQMEQLETSGFLMLPGEDQKEGNYVLVKMSGQSAQPDSRYMPTQAENALYRKIGIDDSIYFGGDEEMEIYYLPELREQERFKNRTQGRPKLIPVATKTAF